MQATNYANQSQMNESLLFIAGIGAAIIFHFILGTISYVIIDATHSGSIFRILGRLFFLVKAAGCLGLLAHNVPVGLGFSLTTVFLFVVGFFQLIF